MNKFLEWLFPPSPTKLAWVIINDKAKLCILDKYAGQFSAPPALDGPFWRCIELSHYVKENNGEIFETKREAIIALICKVEKRIKQLNIQLKEDYDYLEFLQTKELPNCTDEEKDNV